MPAGLASRTTLGDGGPFGGDLPAPSPDAAGVDLARAPRGERDAIDESEDATADAASTLDASEAAVPTLDAARGGLAGGLVPDGACTEPLAPGDLQIEELMIESVAGAGDDGEWLEVKSLRACATNLRGLHGECPRGAKVSSFDVTDDRWIPPGGTFLVADSSNPTVDHSLPEPIVVWSGHVGDVLRNKGSTITLSLSGTRIDALTYPALALAVGDSVAFPSDCDAGARDDFTKWQRSSASWFPGFLGSPNSPNADVHCPP
jgi:hypothetical protein